MSVLWVPIQSVLALHFCELLTRSLIPPPLALPPLKARLLLRLALRILLRLLIKLLLVSS
jgi:hypothetical protein